MTVSSALDAQRMARALYLAAQARNGCDPNPRVGCVIDRDGVIVGEGWHRRAGEDHAEVAALKQAGAAARGATVYVTLEPCSHQGRTGPCTERLVEAGVTRVVYAVGDPNPVVSGTGDARLRAAGLKVTAGLMSETARELNRGFFSRHERRRPFVLSKIASSLDGRTALANGQSQWISSPASRADVQRLRSRASAILTGTGTVIADDPRLNVRLDADGSWQPPARIVVDSALRTPPEAQLFAMPGAVIVMTGDGPAAAAQRLIDAGAQIERIAVNDEGRLCLEALLRRLAEMAFNEIMVEAGPGLNGALLAAGLIDELVVYQAPVVLGSEARPMFDLAPLTSMADRPTFEVAALRQLGPDWRLRLRPGSL